MTVGIRKAFAKSEINTRCVVFSRIQLFIKNKGSYWMPIMLVKLPI